MALIHYFLPLSSNLSKKMVKFQEQYVIDGKMVRFACFEDVPKPINSFADDAAGEALMVFYMRNKLRAVGVQDKYICKHLPAFKVVETYFSGFVPCVGLNYYGFTIIPWSSLPDFISILKCNSVRNNYRKLVSLCQDAYLSKCDVLHCGI